MGRVKPTTGGTRQGSHQAYCQHVERIAWELERAINQDPLLVRLPGMAQLARLLGGTVWQVRQSLGLLADRGLVRRSYHGYEILHPQRARTVPIETVILIDDYQSVAPFCHYVALGADRQCRHLGITMVSQPAERLLAEPRRRQWSAVSTTGWLLFVPPADDSIQFWCSEGRRFVLVDQNPLDIPAPSVRMDYTGAADRAVEHIRAMGHRDVALACRSWAPMSTPLRRRGFDFMDDWLMSMDDGPQRIIVPWMVDWLQRWRQAPTRPTAIIIHNVLDALIFLDVCRSLEVSVPDQLSVLAVGSECGRGWDRLTLSSTGRAVDLGQAAVDMLVQPDVMRDCPSATLTGSLDRPGLTVRCLAPGACYEL